MRSRIFGSLVPILLLILGSHSTNAQTAIDAPKPTPEVQALLEKGQAEGNAYHWDAALQCYAQALEKARSLNDKDGEATALNNTGEIYQASGKPQQAVSFFNQALPLMKAAGDKAGEATTLSNLGYFCYTTGQPTQALAYYNQALILQKAVGDKSGEANTLIGMGVVQGDTGQPQTALDCYNQALPLLREIQDKRGTAAAFNNMGAIYSNTGQPQAALDYYHQALPLQREIGDKEGLAYTLDNIGQLCYSIGQPQQALDYYNQAIPLQREIGNKRSEASTLTGIGQLYTSIGQPQRALEFYQQALALARELQNKAVEAAALNHLGRTCASMNQRKQALEFYQQSLMLRKQIGDKAGESATLHNIGALYTRFGQPQQALDYFQQALPLARAVGDLDGEGRTLFNIGQAYAQCGQTQKAIAFYQQALPLFQEVDDKRSEASVLSFLATAEQAQGKTAPALDHARQSVMLLETLRANLGSLSESKQSFLEENISAYHYCLNLLLKQAAPSAVEEAFLLAQQTKARVLLDLLAGGKADFSRFLNSKDSFRLAELRENARRANVQLTQALLQKTNPGQMDLLRTRLKQSEQALQTFSDELLSRYPQIASRQPARSIRLSEIASLLPQDTALLEYVTLRSSTGRQMLDETALFCLTVQKGKPLLRAYRIPVRRKDLTVQIADFRDACASPDRAYKGKARDLYSLLLKPVEKQIAGKKRLLLCPDGALWSLPFPALSAEAGTRSPVFLWQRYQISYAYSGSMLARILHDRSGRQGTRPSNLLLAVANPDFGDLASGAITRRTDARVAAKPVVARDVLAQRGGFQPLPGTQAEAAALRRLYPDARILTGRLADKARVLQEGGQYRILHFATHGHYNHGAPLYSFVVLAEPLSHSSSDMFLTASDIFEQNWNADLVVLSACETGEGKQVNGEGIVGLTWALAGAGVQSEIVSQWKVNDASTSQLMQSFYQNLKAGQGKASALRKAALTLMKDGQHDHPYYWAAFFLIGDWQ